jgi:acyl-CoA synthetase (AMP-forming)/AMP-acid ligase II
MRLIDRSADLFPDRHCLHHGVPANLAKDALSGVKAPKSIDFIASPPRSPVGNVLKKALREPSRVGRDRKI